MTYQLACFPRLPESWQKNGGQKNNDRASPSFCPLFFCHSSAVWVFFVLFCGQLIRRAAGSLWAGLSSPANRSQNSTTRGWKAPPTAAKHSTSVPGTKTQPRFPNLACRERSRTGETTRTVQSLGKISVRFSNAWKKRWSPFPAEPCETGNPWLPILGTPRRYSPAQTVEMS